MSLFLGIHGAVFQLFARIPFFFIFQRFTFDFHTDVQAQRLAEVSGLSGERPELVRFLFTHHLSKKQKDISCQMDAAYA